MTTIETPRLLLRQFGEADLDAYADFCADPEVMRHIGEGKSLTRAESWRNMAMVIGHWQLRGYGLWAVEERASGALVGRAGFWKPEGWPGFELGWLLGRAHWGKGFATEAARAALDYGFTQMNRPRIISVIRPGNERSIRVAERLGERFEARMDVQGTEALIYAMDREHWRTEKAPGRDFGPAG